VTTNWKKNTKKNTMKLKELSLLKRKQENKYYLRHRGNKHAEKEYNFITSESLTHYFQTADHAGREYTLLKASTANASSLRYSM
jgi:ribosomal protein L32